MEGFQYIACVYVSLELFIAVSIYVLHWRRKEHFVLRLVLSLLAYAAIATGIITVFRRIQGQNPFVYMVYYSILFLMILAMMYCCFQVQFKDVLFAGVCGYATQHLAYTIITAIVELTGINTDPYRTWYIILVGIVPYIAVSILIYVFLIHRSEDQGELLNRDMRMIVLALVILVTTIFLSVLVNSTMFQEDSAILTNVICKIYGAICCTLALFIAFILSRQNWLVHEREIMENMLHNMKEQQKLSRENINIINIKCHDLKYRISKISRIQDEQEQKEYIDSIKNAVTIYDNIYKTGNDALDLILTEKSLLCNEYNIKMSSIVNGECLSMMTSTDAYALFGNLLDNAIESVNQEPNEEKRTISIQVADRTQGCHIHIDNYCPVEPTFEEGMPKTIKSNRNYHGFGVRSIKYIVEKYHGDMLMRVENHHFHVDILFYRT